MSRDISFRPLTLEDLPMLHEWLSRPHVAEWWGKPPVLETVVAEYSPAIAGEIPQECFISLLGDEPIGFIQSYPPTGWHHEGWWLFENDPSVRGIDQFLADADRLNQGLGSDMVRAFVARLLDDPKVSRIQTDPAPNNARAIRSYEKAGFVAHREEDTPDGRILLMYCDGPPAGE